MRRFAFLVITALMGASACGGEATDKETPDMAQAAPEIVTGQPLYDKAGSDAPDVTLTRENGAPLAITSFRGTPTLVNLWATWCAPCIAELPALDRLAKDRGYDLNVVAVSQDIGGWDKIRPFLEENPLGTLTVLADSSGALSQALGAAGLPLTILYDAEGKEVWRVNGPREWDQPGGMPPARMAAAMAGETEMRVATDIAYRAQGSDPGWDMTIRPDGTLKVTADDGETVAEFPAPATVGAAPFSLAVAGAAGALSVAATDEECADTGGGRAYPNKVEIELNGKRYSGCGGPV